MKDSGYISYHSSFIDGEEDSQLPESAVSGRNHKSSLEMLADLEQKI